MIFRQLFDRDTCTYTYLLADPQLRKAVVVDPVLELVERDAQLVRELHLDLMLVVETHVHADHVTGGQALKAIFGARTAVARASGASADVLLEDGDAIDFGRQSLEVRATPGHTLGCLTYVLHDQSCAFTGDALLVRGCGRTDFQDGDAHTLYRSIRDKIFSLPDDTLLYPGHDYQGRTRTTVREERLHNPRLGGGRTEDDFVAIMDALQLSPPAKIGVAVPANLQGGLRDGAIGVAVLPQEVPWAPVSRSPTGAPEVAAPWVEANLGSSRIVDVRQPDEFVGELGHIPGAELVPLETLVGVARSWSKSGRVVLVCRSGGRSADAALTLERLGFREVASLRGGMLAWQGARD